MDILVQTVKPFAVVEVLGDKVATEVEATTANAQEIKAHIIDIIVPRQITGLKKDSPFHSVPGLPARSIYHKVDGRLIHDATLRGLLRVEDNVLLGSTSCQQSKPSFVPEATCPPQLLLTTPEVISEH